MEPMPKDAISGLLRLIQLPELFHDFDTALVVGNIGEIPQFPRLGPLRRIQVGYHADGNRGRMGVSDPELKKLAHRVGRAPADRCGKRSPSVRALAARIASFVDELLDQVWVVRVGCRKNNGIAAAHGKRIGAERQQLRSELWHVLPDRAEKRGIPWPRRAGFQARPELDKTKRELRVARAVDGLLERRRRLAA